MAAASAVNAGVEFHVCWEGRRVYRGYLITALNILQKNKTLHHIPLGMEEDIHPSFSCSVETAQNIKILAVISRVYEQTSKVTINSLGDVKYKQKTRYGNLPVHIVQKPEFQPGEIYHIHVTHERESLQATFQKKDATQNGYP